MPTTVALRSHVDHTAPTLGPAGLEAAFRAFFEGLGRKREPASAPEVIPAARPSRAELITPAFLGAPVAVSPLSAVADRTDEAHARR
ncbi:hypothetical protein [Phenylobacterium sp.]|uniref:hypothetical protein n=1 Tax=Phenylobacterium sp. TaxID=1871053 RepID=UPI0035AED739